MKKLIILVLIIHLSVLNFAQNSVSGNNISDGINAITTAVPFLSITPDSRAGAMGDVGVATSPDQNSNYWNPAKLVFIDSDFGVSFSYVPWLSNLVSDIDLTYLSGHYKLNDNLFFGASLRYFSLGSIVFTNDGKTILLEYNPNEFSIDGSVSIKLSKYLSGGMTARYARSDLTGAIGVNNTISVPGNTFAIDLGMYYQIPTIVIGGKKSTLAFGTNISNIGNKMSYGNKNKSDFIPINLRLGSALTLELDDYNKLSFAFDINKLLVPTPPIYLEEDINGNNVSSQKIVAAGKDPNVTVVSGIFASFSDAPGTPLLGDNGKYILKYDGGGYSYEVEKGSVLREELREITLGTGVEYSYNNFFFVRCGYFTEHKFKGNRKYLTFGAGTKYNFIGIDFSYLSPFYVGKQVPIRNSPLQNTIRFTIYADFNK